MSPSKTKANSSSSGPKRQKRGKPYPQAQVVHTEGHISVLDANAPTTNYNGLVNFFLLLFGGMMIRLILENYLKYGILVTLPGFNFDSSDYFMSFAILLFLLFNFFFAFFTEKFAANKAKEIFESSNSSNTSDKNSPSKKIKNSSSAENKSAELSESESSIAVTNSANNNNSDNTTSKPPVDRKEVEAINKKNQLEYEKAFSKIDSADKIKFKEMINRDFVTLILQSLNIFFALAVPSFIVFNHVSNPLLGTAAMMTSVVLSLKLFSYYATNLDLRRAYLYNDNQFNKDLLLETKFSKQDILSINASCEATVYIGRPISYDIPYPQNIKLSNLIYFMAVPTLCYQPSYPKSSHNIRPSFVAKRLLEIVFLTSLMYIVVHQYAFPTLFNSVTAIESKNQAWVSERVLKLSVAISLLWLVGFYTFFHSTLNLFAELLNFSDRRFYLDWWNSTDLGTYWRYGTCPSIISANATS
ncbi:Diacylglycerol O-acyltransferase 1 [Smittium culicis]|uniref:O-acyltransferase n=1 Tax=Smittium culicis TaxID=133412 RepID=A0A1R1Y1F8_9FUNG|nr:Diacylglycerol O-acyltransferase 1 [Smittium culicis]